MFKPSLLQFDKKKSKSVQIKAGQMLPQNTMTTSLARKFCSKLSKSDAVQPDSASVASDDASSITKSSSGARYVM